MTKQVYNVPPEEAIRYFRAKSNKLTFSWQDLWAEEHTQAFTIAKVGKLDLLRTFRDSLDQALVNGETFQQWKKNITPTLSKEGWLGRGEAIDFQTGELIKDAELGTPRRLKTIYDTNMRQARNAGQWEQIQETKQQLPYLQYRIGPSVNHRVDHVQWDRLVLSADDPWWDTHMPMNGWGCKCRVIRMTRRQAEKAGISTTPKVEYVEHENKRKGIKVSVPKGVHPDFASNPGKDRFRNLGTKYLEPHVGRGYDDIVQYVIRDYWADPRLASVIQTAKYAHPAGMLDEELRKHIQTRTPLVLISKDTALKVVKNHPDLSTAHLSDIPTVFQEWTEVYRHKSDPDQFALLMKKKGEPRFWMVIRAASNPQGKIQFVASFHKLVHLKQLRNRQTNFELIKRKE